MKTCSRRLSTLWGAGVLLLLTAIAGRFHPHTETPCRAAENAAAVPVAGAAKEAASGQSSKTSSDTAQYAQEVRALLNAGLDPSPDLASAKTHYYTARGLCPTDPRLYQACGLVLLKQSRNDAALKQFRLATEQSGPLYAIGWQALIRLEAAMAQYPETAQSLVALAKTIEQRASSGQAVGTDCAAWMGRMMAFLETIDASSQAAKDAISSADAQIRKILAPDRCTAYESSKQKLFVTTETTPVVPGAPPDNGEAGSRTSRDQAVVDKVREEKRRIGIEKDKSLSQAKQSQTALQEKLAPLDKELAELETKYSELFQSLQRIMASLSAIEHEKDTADRWISMREAAMKSAPGVVFSATPVQDAMVQSLWFSVYQQSPLLPKWLAPSKHFVLEREATLFKEQAYPRLVNFLRQQPPQIQPELAKIRTRASYLLQSRHEILAQLQQTQQQTEEQLQSLEAWEKRVMEKAKRVSVRRARTLPPLAPKTLLDTCFPLDFELEQRRILASLATGRDGNPKFASPAHEAQYVPSIRKLLEAGLDTGSESLDTARLHYDTALALCNSDPRLFYAWGLVCLNHQKLGEAQEQFELATRSAGRGYPPAWKELARTQILRKTPNQAIESLVEFARALEVPTGQVLVHAQKEECASLLGRTIGLLKQTPGNLQVSVNKADAAISGLFHASLRNAYDDGKHQTTRWTHETAADANQTDGPVKKKNTRRLEEKRDQLEDMTDKNRVSAEELRRTLDGRTKLFQEQYNKLQSAEAQLQSQAAEIARRMSDGAPGSTLQRQLDVVLRQIAAIQRQERLLSNAHDAFVAEISSKDAELRRTKSELERRENDLKRAEQIIGGQTKSKSPSQATSTTSLIAAFSSFLPLDYKAEAKRLLDSYSVQNAPTASSTEPGGKSR